MIGALWYLILTTLRNRVARQLARVKRPRYAFALLFGGAYMVLILFQPFSTPSTPISPTGAPISVGLNPVTSGFIGITLAITVILWWLRGGVSGALAFQPAEAQFLFPAPIPRRVLVGYRVMRSQFLLLINALIWMSLVRRWGVSLSMPERYASAWVFFSFLSLHRLGAALVQTEPVTFGRRVAFIAGRLLAGAAAVTIVVSALPVLFRFGQMGMADSFRAFGVALASPPASYGLALFRLVVAPISAPSPAAWRPAFAIAAGIVVLHLIWVLSMNVEFEEAAVLASADLARRVAAMRSRRSGGAAVFRPAKVKRTTRLPLAPTGPAFAAIVWKNTVGFLRSDGTRSLIFFVVAVAVLPAVMRFLPSRRGADSLEVGMMFLTPGLVLMLMTFVIGPRILRHDLRQDLLSLAVLKTYPMRGLELVAGELISPTLALTAVHALAVVIAVVAASPAFRASIGGPRVLMALLVAPLAFGSLNAANLTIQNGAALMFPAWVKLGPDSGGMEAIGQNLLFTIGAMVVLLLSLLIPAVWGAMFWALTRPLLGDWSLAAGVLAGAAALIAEVGWMIVRLGKVFEKTEPSAVG